MPDATADLERAEVRATVLGEVCVVGPSGATVQVHHGVHVVAAGVVDAFGARLAGDLEVTDLVASEGGLVLRGLDPGGHRVVLTLDGCQRELEVVVPEDDELPADHEQRVLSQVLEPGYGYLETRDGTLLSVNVALPEPERWGPGPHPTVIQYSGYHPSRPGFLTGRPELDSGMNTEANLCLHSGFAVVGINMRGSGGSGGAFQLFSRAVALDGHDAVEVVARQTWCRPHPERGRCVGMIGRSMPGFSQVLVASTRPPSLGAITPAALGALPYDGMFPGGIPNVWLQAHVGMWDVDPDRPDHLTVAGAGVVAGRYRFWDAWLVEHLATTGDLVAARNQLLRGHNVDHSAKAARLPDPAGDELDPLDILDWVPEVAAPTFLMGTWQDQDSGSGFAMLPQRFPTDTEVHVLAANGTHEESRLPSFVAEWLGFLTVRVAGVVPGGREEAQRYLDAAYADQFPGGLPLPAPRTKATTATEAEEELSTRSRTTLLLELGAGDVQPPGYPYPSTTLTFESWPPPATPTRWHLHPGGLLDEAAAGPQDGATSYRYDPRTKLPGSAHVGFDIVGPEPAYDWRPLGRGFAATFVTGTLEDDLLLVGPASLDLWIRCTAPDVDLEVSLTEVRPDGNETFVQNGWLRASARPRHEDRSTELIPWLVHGGVDSAPLDRHAPTPMRIPIGWHGHLFRRGSRLRISIEAPGGNQPHWSFDPLWPDGHHQGEPVVVEVVHDERHPSSLVLARVDVEPPGGAWPPLPPPGALRRQPSRRYEPDGVLIDPEVPLVLPPPVEVPPPPDSPPPSALSSSGPPTDGPPPPLPGWTGRVRATLRPVKRAYRAARRRVRVSPATQGDRHRSGPDDARAVPLGPRGTRGQASRLGLGGAML